MKSPSPLRHTVVWSNFILPELRDRFGNAHAWLVSVCSANSTCTFSSVWESTWHVMICLVSTRKGQSCVALYSVLSLIDFSLWNEDVPVAFAQTCFINSCIKTQTLSHQRNSGAHLLHWSSVMFSTDAPRAQRAQGRDLSSRLWEACKGWALCVGSGAKITRCAMSCFAINSRRSVVLSGLLINAFISKTTQPDSPYRHQSTSLHFRYLPF